MASLEKTLTDLAQENTPYSRQEFKEIVSYYKKRDSSLIEQPFYLVWNKMIYRQDPDISFITECGLIPQEKSKILSMSIYQSIHFLYKDTIYMPLFKAMNNLIKDDNAAVLDMESYVKEQIKQNSPVRIQLLKDLEPFYIERNKTNPYKLRYYCLVAQLKFFNNFENEMTSYPSFERQIGDNIKHMIEVCPQFVKKSRSIKLKDNSYVEYLDRLLLHTKLDSEIETKPSIKNIKI